MNRPKHIILLLLLGWAFSLPSYAQDHPQCAQIRFGSVGWLDAGASSAVAGALLNALGYTTAIERLSVPVIFASMKNRNLDVFMEIMVPTMGEALKPYMVDNSVELVTKNLAGTKYTLAANTFASKIGIEEFGDIAEHADALGKTLYSTEPGSDGSVIVQQMINQNLFNLGDFSVIQLTEQELLHSAQNAANNQQPMIMLAIEPHPMNIMFELKYLRDGDSVFGPKFGGADVYTGVRTGFLNDCPNAAVLISRLQFSLAMINQIMTAILELNAKPLVAAAAWLHQHPEKLEEWLSEVSTFDSKPGLPAVRSFIGLP
ncbi:MAG: glycine betaine/proline transport system substrate-binding protein [Parasphingorhabdus sp.]|jgi:glycine betaine/proline transport system substrate-binding protein